MPKQTPTPVSPEALTSATTAGWSKLASRRIWAAGSTDPVSDISGNKAMSQPAEAAVSSSRMWDVRLPLISPFSQRTAASSARTLTSCPNP